MDEYFSPEDWPDVLVEGRGLSVDVLAVPDNDKEPFLAHFNYNDMLWYNEEGDIVTTGFKWQEYKT